MSALRRQLVLAVLVALLTEVVLLRLALRLGPVLPTGVDLLPLFAIVERVGVIALNVSVLAAAALLALAAGEALRATQSTRWLLGLALAGVVAANLGLSVLLAVLSTDDLASLHALLTGLGVAAILGAYVWRTQLGGPLVLAGAAQVLAVIPAASAARLSAYGLPPSALTELLAVLAALALPWAGRIRPTRTEAALGLAAGGLLTLGTSIQPWGMATVAIWTLGFSLYLPPLLYGAALASVVVTLLAGRRLGWDADILVGLTMLGLAGLKLDVSSAALVSVAGLLLVAQTPLRAAQPVAEPEPTPALIVAGSGGHA
ncbi:MAG: hypothetical protein IT306_28005 [Chloroflexi bacterium]|nr:hypothetical protein [Chloroflexota bacterium]